MRIFFLKTCLKIYFVLILLLIPNFNPRAGHVAKLWPILSRDFAFGNRGTGKEGKSRERREGGGGRKEREEGGGGGKEREEGGRTLWK